MIEAVEAVKVTLESPAVDRRIKPKMEDDESNGSASFKFVPYVETTKPFEMSDFYKYSTKFKKSKNGSESSSTSSNDNNNKPPGMYSVSNIVLPLQIHKGEKYQKYRAGFWSNFSIIFDPLYCK